MKGLGDGTVYVEETRHPGARDWIVVPARHTRLLFSPLVARQVVSFLQHGHFRWGA
ncbi:MAG: hypothetical protein H7831_14255 [Magnetococcus sp. WYHC-3]